MRKILITIAGVIALILLALLIVIWMNANDEAVIEKYIKNENLPTVKTDWKGTPVDEKDRFVNAEFPFLPNITELLKWQTSGNPQKEEKRNDLARLEVRDPTEFLQSEQGTVFYGRHAVFFIRLACKTFYCRDFRETAAGQKLVMLPDCKIRRVIFLSRTTSRPLLEETIGKLHKLSEAEILGG